MSSKSKKPNPNAAVPRKKLNLTPIEVPAKRDPQSEAPRGPAREIPEEDRFELPELPEPATYEQVIVAASQFDELSQEVMIAQRLAAMPSQRDGGLPVVIPRMVRPAWAHQLRQLGMICIPELATHELVTESVDGTMQNHTAMTSKKIDVDDLWKIARAQDPSLAKLVDEAETPEEKAEARKVLLSKVPVQYRIALERLSRHSPEDLEPR